jgi:hypothetical protein
MTLCKGTVVLEVFEFFNLSEQVSRFCCKIF